LKNLCSRHIVLDWPASMAAADPGIAAVFFGLQIDPGGLPSVLWQAAILAPITAATKLLTGWWSARHAGVNTPGGLRAGAALVARGEFSIVIAELGVGLEPGLGPLSAAYVLILAVVGPILARLVGWSGQRKSDPGPGRA
jgi:CPA2 family monovalent cation:H+ antiporter-2